MMNANFINLNNITQPFTLFLQGTTGRMGQCIVKLLNNTRYLKSVTFYEIKKNQPLYHSLNKKEGVIVDFSSPLGTQHLLENLLKGAPQQQMPLLIGTTGLGSKLEKLYHLYSQHAPVLVAPNTSLGIALLNKMCEFMAQFSVYTPQITEIHHTQKKDAPSGTALALKKTLEGKTKKNVLIKSTREGTVIGEHHVAFDNDGESIHLSHYAHSRSLFAEGAVVMAYWLLSQKPGLYTPGDLFNFGSREKQGVY